MSPSPPGNKPPLIGFTSSLGGNAQNGTSSGGVGKSLLLGALGGAGTYLSSVPTKVSVSLKNSTVSSNVFITCTDRSIICNIKSIFKVIFCRVKNWKI